MTTIICGPRRTYAIKPHFTPTDPLSRRIFQGDTPSKAIQSADTPLSLREEIKALQRQNATLQQTLRLSSGLRQRFETLFDTSPLGLFTHDAEGQIMEANLTLANLLQVKRAQLIGQHIGSFIAPRDHARFIHHLMQLQENTSHSAVQCTLTLITAQNTEVDVQMESTLQISGTDDANTIHSRISLPETQPQQLTELANNNAQLQKEISERELAEKQARQHQEELAHVARLNTMGEMTSGLAHEINQPLTAISSYAKSCIQLLAGGADKQEQIDHSLKQIGAQAQRAASIVRHLRDFVSKNTTHRKATNLTTVIKLASSMMHHEFQEHNISLDIEIADELPTLTADPIQLEQVAINLLRNASEAMCSPQHSAHPRRLHIKLDNPDATHVRVSISDTGPGIHPDIADRVSTPFYSTKTNGMGLGLAISRTIIEDHGGTLNHETNADGGATFIFTLAIDGKQANLID